MVGGTADQNRQVKLIEDVLANNRDNETSSTQYTKSFTDGNGQQQTAVITQRATPRQTYQPRKPNPYLQNDIRPLRNQRGVGQSLYSSNHYCRDPRLEVHVLPKSCFCASVIMRHYAGKKTLLFLICGSIQTIYGKRATICMQKNICGTMHIYADQNYLVLSRVLAHILVTLQPKTHFCSMRFLWEGYYAGLCGMSQDSCISILMQYIS